MEIAPRIIKQPPCSEETVVVVAAVVVAAAAAVSYARQLGHTSGTSKWTRTT